MTPRTAVYVALGAHRVRAARAHAGRLAADGADVRLVVADGPAWDAPVPDGVTVHRVPAAADPRRTIRAARRLLQAADGPRAGADLFVAGDPLAIPATMAAAAAMPDAEVRLEPTERADRRTAPADLAVVTPWYPSPNNPFAGAFVEAAIAAVQRPDRRVSILHTEDWTPAPPTLAHLTAVSADRLVARTARGGVTDTPLGELTRVPVLIERHRDYATWAHEHVNALRAALPTGMIEAPLIHAHTGIYGGVLAANLAHTDARIVVTEHAGFLQRIYAQPPSRFLYEDVLDRIEVMLCVTEHLREQVATQFPRYTDKLRVLPNVVEFDRFPAGPAPADLLRWVYVGRLIAQKRVDLLLEAFALVAREEPGATLALVGDGDQGDRLRARAAELGLAERVSVRPAVPPDQVAGVLHEHDLLVHASPAETFGLTVVEAVAAGLPVLVAGSDGPRETLAGIEGAAGELVEVSDDPAVLAAGYRALRARRGGLDLPRARATLVGRYGREAVSARLEDAYAGRLAPAAAPAAARPAPVDPDAAERVLLIGINPPSYRRTTEFANKLVAAGCVVDLVTTEPTHWRRQHLDDRVRMHLVGATEERLVPARVTAAVVDKAPGRLLRGLRRATRRTSAVWPEVTVARAQAFHRRGSQAVQVKLYGRAYRVVRPMALWRIFRRDVLPRLDLTRVRRVVVSGSSGVAIGWRLAKADPTLEVSTDIEPGRILGTPGVRTTS